MLQHMKLGTKLMLGFSLVAMITLVLGVIGYYGAVKGEKSVQEIGAVRLPGIDSLLDIEGEAQAIRGTLRTLMIPGLPKEVRERQRGNLAKSGNAYEAAWKIYEPLPQTPEEAMVWKDFVPAWDAWRAENNKFMETMEQWEKLGMSDPMALGRTVESLTKDHYRLLERILTLMNMNKTFDGGEDHTACNAGKWMASFKSDNPALMAEIKTMQDPHKRFHEAVKKIKEAHDKGSGGETDIYTREMVPAMQEVFRSFEGIIRIIDEAIVLSEQARDQLLGPVTVKMRTAQELLGKVVEINQTVAAEEVKVAHAQGVFLMAFSA
ncbi:MAG: MCP four helix bundle domain-containing protein, partial [Desulfobacula sp.]